MWQCPSIPDYINRRQGIAKLLPRFSITSSVPISFNKGIVYVYSSYALPLRFHLIKKVSRLSSDTVASLILKKALSLLNEIKCYLCNFFYKISTKCKYLSVE